MRSNPVSTQCPGGDAGRSNADGIGATIRAIRTRLGLTQIAFSKTLFIRQNTLSQFETGHLKPSTERLIQLLRIARTDDEKDPIVAALGQRGILASDLAISIPKSAVSADEGIC